MSQANKATIDSIVKTANDELDTVVKTLEEATDKILSAAENAQKAISASGLEGDKLKAVNDEMAKVFEGCNFQDLTGQRLTNVTEHLNTIAAAVDGSAEVTSLDASLSEEERHAKSLMNGPQLDQPDQADIDKIFGD
jgi:chemotaxis protein CheZ